MSNYPGALSGGFITHRFQSLKADQPDPSLINPTQWNQSHIIGSGAIQSGAIGSGAIQSVNVATLPDVAQTPGTLNNIGFGYGVLSGVNNTSGYSNTAVGRQAMYSDTTGFQNVAVGHQALYSQTANQHNTALGYQALYNNNDATAATANDNTAVGYQAAWNNTTGYEQCAFGMQALYSNVAGFDNSAFGHKALYSNTSGYDNVAVGLQALYSNTIGILNVAVGFQSLYNVVNGASNVAIGYYAGHYDTSGISALWIDSMDRGNLANSQTQSLIYGKFLSGGGSGQFLTINGLINSPFGIAFTGSGSTMGTGPYSATAAWQGTDASGGNILINAPLGKEIKFYENAVPLLHFGSGALYPEGDATYGLGDLTHRWSNVIGVLHSVYHNSGDAQPTTQIADNALNFGAGVSTVPDAQISRFASGQLSLTKLASSTLTVGGHLIRILNKAGIPTDADFTNPADGMMVIDTADTRLYVRTGGGWHYAALT